MVISRHACVFVVFILCIQKEEEKISHYIMIPIMLYFISDVDVLTYVPCIQRWLGT